ncbi:hypothetical protein C8N35_11194 [Breoghania corrubedonensis]|uniref:Uncharacterized protein n=1 Tax=Breoghania corrubedonensis TaxID=665038 RepID=A0A2T5UYT4_9HYPH|nr:hypothetical protein [Breoghania corrubedonensis]PTW56631.1 hypothetical protein C8N35_11194 [Breoghania corrubedonensis]
MSLPQALVDFSSRCEARFGAGSAGYNDDGAFVGVRGRVVHVNLDPNANRVVVWSELARPEHAGFEALEQAAMAWTSDALLAMGLVVGVNRNADLIVLGRSIEQDALGTQTGLDLVGEVAQQAEAAAAMLARAAAEAGNGAGGRSSGSDGDAVIIHN